jgi:cytochrome c oxidase cbb3-type subunit III
MLCCIETRLDAAARQAHDSQSAAPQKALLAGKRSFATTCASCHGLDGRGGERAPNILARPEVQRMSDADIARVIRQGTPSNRMPAFGDSLDAATINALTAYVRSLLQTNRQNIKLPGDPAAGKALFFGKARCSECHMVDGEGGFLGADLSIYALSHSAADIRDAIADPNKNSDRRQKTISVKTRDGQQFTGIARNEDNFSVQLQTPDGAFHLLMKSDLTRLDYQPHSLMPADYAQRLTTSELDDIASFLMRAAAVNSKSNAYSLQQDSAGRRH